jgi:ATP-dependent RNA helicase SUPV3L1/SUV3
VELLPAEALDGDQALRVRRRLEAWLAGRLATGIAPLQKLGGASLSGAARGVAYQIVEGLGVAVGEDCQRLVRELDEPGRKALARLGVRLGFFGAYLKPLMSSRDLDLRAMLWAIAAGSEHVPLVPAKGEVALDADDGLADDFYHAIGYRRLGTRVLRVDMAERLAAEARTLTRKAPAQAPVELVSLSGSSREAFAGIMAALGFRAVVEGDRVMLSQGKRRRPSHKTGARKRQADHDPRSPFAKLAELELAR